MNLTQAKQIVTEVYTILGWNIQDPSPEKGFHLRANRNNEGINIRIKMSRFYIPASGWERYQYEITSWSSISGNDPITRGGADDILAFVLYYINDEGETDYQNDLFLIPKDAVKKVLDSARNVNNKKAFYISKNLNDDWFLRGGGEASESFDGNEYKV